jgi:transcription factor IIIB subunit 2
MARTAATHKPNAPRRPIPGKSPRPVINAPTIFTKKRDEAAKKKEEAARAKAQRAQRKKVCRREDCPGGGIEDGICMGCGTVIDDSNIVSEVQFGENSSGAAVLQGVYLPGDQGGVRSAGPGLRGMGNEGEGREATIREGNLCPAAHLLALLI